MRLGISKVVAGFWLFIWGPLGVCPDHWAILNSFVPLEGGAVKAAQLTRIPSKVVCAYLFFILRSRVGNIWVGLRRRLGTTRVQHLSIPRLNPPRFSPSGKLPPSPALSIICRKERPSRRDFPKTKPRCGRTERLEGNMGLAAFSESFGIILWRS